MANRPNDRTHRARQAELLDVQLLDVLAQIEALLRGGREIQRESLRVRGAPVPGGGSQRTAATRICWQIGKMKSECEALCAVLAELDAVASALDATLNP